MVYKLSAVLQGHSSDVRALATPTNDLILSASRDTTAIAWNRTSPGAKEFTNETVLRAGSRYINAVAFIPPTPDAPKGFAVTAGQETVINLFDLSKPRDDPDYTLVGHTENVCTLDVSPAGTIISGSWDKTAKVWKNFSLVYDLKGHQQSVWAVLAVDEDSYLTASADKTIRRWHQHKTVHTFTGHQDAVRGLALVPDIGFASCSNDSEVRVWTFGGDLIYSLSGHTSFVYSLSILPDGNVVSSGEDRTVRIWKDGECAQTIVHPAISVWAVSTLPNGDIVSGASDGVVRVFSSVEERWASADELKAYEDQVASQALPSQQVGDVKKSDLPGPEALLAPGKKPGEVKMIKNAKDVVEAHQWDSASNSWQKIGDVVDAVGQGRKQLYQGKEYDYVFDVDIQDGVPPLKLPYNVTENPYSAAQRFLEANELSLNYIDEVVKFIEKNTAGVNIGTGNEEYVDPYTGASRYRSNAGTAATGPAEYMDPFTGASRYRAQPQAPAPSVPSANLVDPFTGASRYSGQPTASHPTTKILPVSKFVNFKQANVTAMQGKILQFNDVLQQEISTSSLAMYPDDHDALNEIFAKLSKLTATPPSPTTPLSPSHVEHIVHILERWPPSQRFPIIDLSRLLIGYCPEAFASPGEKEKFIEALFQSAEWNAPWTSPLPKHRETNILLLLRSLANAFQEGTEINGEWLMKLLQALGEAPFTIFGKNQRVALATVLFNISCVSLTTPLSPETRNQYITALLSILNTEKTESEAAYRTLVALGNIVYTSKQGSRLDEAQIAQIRHLLGSLHATFPEDRVKSISQEISSLL
ncbi:phospholipase A-2-activating protein [Coprinopsis cinerea okayama7|uniref:Phospholipase A-2-activating protein n=1 Tax=Coprinopsis cinerea (strain Okayama-7 / 130 / ATCC MYA-4618 / FGSC 9003) TaxID=240176 RepID=A8NEW6_COPC7|nr:phospholipase A-2-activating protein [Coprinopsis cinerea okayama7\|eukprot:XP_001833148.2 phospholipase A-2-activating protein [Coprinopsis cinerea okayama7\